MPRGYPDFFGQSIFPKYGSPLYTGVLTERVAFGATATILTIAGKGRSVGGRFYHTADNPSLNGVIRVYLDTQLIFSRAPSGNLESYINSGQGEVCRMIRHDAVTPYFTYVIMPDITWETQFRADFANGDLAIGMNVYFEMFYYLVN